MQGGGVCFTATNLEAREAIGEIIGLLSSLGLNSDLLGSVEIALAEVVNNVVEHAYGGRAPGPVGIYFDLDGPDLWISVWDRGQGFVGDLLPEGRPVDLPKANQDLPEGGFGWFLIRNLAAELSYARTRGLNRLSLRFSVPV